MINQNKMTAERIKEIQMETAYPNSMCVQQALFKVWNECIQPQESKAIAEDENHKAYLKGYEVGFMKAREQMKGLIDEQDGLSPINL